MIKSSDNNNYFGVSKTESHMVQLKEHSRNLCSIQAQQTNYQLSNVPWTLIVICICMFLFFQKFVLSWPDMKILLFFYGVRTDLTKEEWKNHWCALKLGSLFNTVVFPVHKAVWEEIIWAESIQMLLTVLLVLTRAGSSESFQTWLTSADKSMSSPCSVFVFEGVNSKMWSCWETILYLWIPIIQISVQFTSV